MPAGYAEALPQIKSYRDTIRSAIEAGTPSKTHRSLGELDIVLNKLPAIAKASSVPKEQGEGVKTTGQELRNFFNPVHPENVPRREPHERADTDPNSHAH